MDDFKDDEVVDKALETFLAKYPDEVEATVWMGNRGERERYIYDHPRGVLAGLGEILSGDGVTLLAYLDHQYYIARRGHDEYLLSHADLRQVLLHFVDTGSIYRFNWESLRRR